MKNNNYFLARTAHFQVIPQQTPKYSLLTITQHSRKTTILQFLLTRGFRQPLNNIAYFSPLCQSFSICITDNSLFELRNFFTLVDVAAADSCIVLISRQKSNCFLTHLMLMSYLQVHARAFRLFPVKDFSATNQPLSLLVSLFIFLHMYYLFYRNTL